MRNGVNDDMYYDSNRMAHYADWSLEFPDDIEKVVSEHGLSKYKRWIPVSFWSTCDVVAPGAYMLFSYAIGGYVPGRHRVATAADTNLTENVLTFLSESVIIFNCKFQAIPSPRERKRTPPDVFEYGGLAFVSHFGKPDYDVPVRDRSDTFLCGLAGGRAGAWVVSRTKQEPYRARVVLEGMCRAPEDLDV